MAVWPISAVTIIIIITVTVSVHPYSNFARKCCEQKQSLNLVSLHQANCSNSEHHWLYMNFTYGLPNCNYVILPAEENDKVSCIDNFISHNESESVKAAVCINETNPDEFKVPPVNYLRKCCPLNRPYDTTTQTCFSSNISDNNHTQDLINILIPGFDGVVDINTEMLQCKPDQALVDVEIEYNKIKRESSGSIVVEWMDGNIITLNPDDCCVDLTQINGTLIVRMCQDSSIACKPYGSYTCIRKCCPNGQIYIEKECQPSSRSISVKSLNYTEGISINNITVAFLIGDICKYEKYISDDTDYAIDLNGYIHTEDLIDSTSEYCIERTESINSSDEGGDYPFVCFPENNEIGGSRFTLFHAINMMISCVFLFFTLIVYSCLQQLRNLHGKTLMCHVSCLLVAYSCLVYVQIFSDPNIDLTTCATLGYMIQFSFLAAFCWLNVISFDIWWTFGSMQPAIGKQARDRRRFILYSAYAWSVSSFFTGAAFISDHTNILPEILRPAIGNSTCWFSTHTNGMYIFFTTPQSILFAMNLVFFTVTAIRCSKIKNELHKIAHSSLAEKRFRSDKRKLVMNLKLFIVMGVSWTLEVISLLMGPLYLWSISDTANSLQGLLIFAIFVFKRRVLKAFWQRVKEVICRVKPIHHRPSCSTLYTMTPSELRISSMAINSIPSASIRNNNNRHLKKSKSENRLAVLSVSSPAIKHRQHHRCLSTSSANRLTVNNNHQHNFWPGHG